jgi:ubiquinone/menaquinone biosynthesis C-methylase UbiE
MDAVASSYDSFAPHYDKAFHSRRCRIEDRLLAVRLRHFLSDVTGDLLDVGCGTGAFMRLVSWPADRYTGIDVSPGMLAEAMRDYPRGEFIQASVEAMPLSDAQFGAVISIFSALSYVTVPVRAMQEIHRVLQPRGRCFIMVNAPRWHRLNASCAGDMHLHVAPHAWSRWQAEQRCRLAGLTDVKLSAFSILPTPLLGLDALIARKLPDVGRYLIIEARRA